MSVCPSPRLSVCLLVCHRNKVKQLLTPRSHHSQYFQGQPNAVGRQFGPRHPWVRPRPLKEPFPPNLLLPRVVRQWVVTQLFGREGTRQKKCWQLKTGLEGGAGQNFVLDTHSTKKIFENYLVNHRVLLMRQCKCILELLFFLKKSFWGFSLFIWLTSRPFWSMPYKVLIG